MANVKIAMSKKGMMIALIALVLLLGGGGGYLLWRVNQKDTVAPTDSDASGTCEDCLCCSKTKTGLHDCKNLGDDKGVCQWCSGVYVLCGGECCEQGTGPGWKCEPKTDKEYYLKSGEKRSCSACNSNSAAPLGQRCNGGNPNTYECGTLCFHSSCGKEACDNLGNPAPLPKYTLTYKAGANGRVDNPGPHTVEKGKSGPIVTAIPNSGYHFVKWSDGKTDNPRTDTNVQAPATYTASFEALPVEKVTLKYVAGTGGTITGTATQIINKGANGTPVTAKPNSGYKFIKWSDGKTTETRTDSNVQADATYTAEFTNAKVYRVAYSISPDDQGAVIKGTNPQTIDDGGTGTEVTVETKPLVGSYCVPLFAYWTVNGVKDTTQTGATRKETNVKKDMNIVAKLGINWDGAFKYYTAGYGFLKADSGTPSINPIIVTFKKGEPCPHIPSVTAVPSKGYKFAYWLDTITKQKDTSPLATANPRKDTTAVVPSYKANVAVTAVFVPDQNCGDGICSEDENASTCPDDCSAECGDGICSENENPQSCPTDCPSVCGDGMCTEGEDGSTCPADCGTSGGVPQTGLFDETENILIMGGVLLLLGIGWTWVSTLPKKAYTSISKASSEYLTRKDRSIRESRRNRLERRIK